MLGVLFQASQSPEAGLREAAFRIFSTTPGIIEKSHEDAVVGVFSKGFKDDVVSVCFPLETFLDGVLTRGIGAHCSHGGLRFVLPLDLQEVAT